MGNLFAGAARIMAESGEPTDSKVPDVTVEDADPIERADLQVAPAEDLGSAESFESGESTRWPPPCASVCRAAGPRARPRRSRWLPGRAARRRRRGGDALFAQAAERLENAVFSPGEGAPRPRTARPVLPDELLGSSGSDPRAPRRRFQRSRQPGYHLRPRRGAEAMSTFSRPRRLRGLIEGLARPEPDRSRWAHVRGVDRATRCSPTTSWREDSSAHQRAGSGHVAGSGRPRPSGDF